MEPSESIKDFCRIEKISHSGYYNLKRRGKGPKEYQIGRNKRITPEAHAQWRLDRQAEAAE